MRKVVILTGTRADFGKLKPIMSKLEASSDFELHIFATGMHPLYGNTIREIQKCGFKNIFPCEPHQCFDDGPDLGSNGWGLF